MQQVFRSVIMLAGLSPNRNNARVRVSTSYIFGSKCGITLSKVKIKLSLGFN
jgi:hypothetical protein